jgi:phosphoesterase RecJ-like protein
VIAPEDHSRFREAVETAGRFVLVTHMNPDGDALGAEFGLARFLIDRGKEVVLVNDDPVPPVLRFLDRGDVPLEVYDPAVHDRRLAEADQIVLLDNSAPDRLGRMEAVLVRLADRVLCIDHHPTRGTVWGGTILDVGSCAAAAMVHELTAATGWEPSEAAAEALYVGIATDTGFFRFNSTTPDALRICADLMERGVDPARCFREIYERNSPAYTRILGRALAGLRLDAGGRVVSVRIPLDSVGEDLDVDTSEMTTPLLAIDRVRIALLFRELRGGRVKVSLRSKGALDVHALAVGFGGGGHRNASGIVTEGALDDVSTRVVEQAVTLVETAGDDR